MPTAQVERTLEHDTPSLKVPAVPARPDVSNPMKGIKAELGTLERPIMDIIWNQGAPVEVGDVVMSLRNHPDPQKRREVAYTTVMTTMTRMATKGYLIQDRSSVPYKYTPAISRDEFRIAKVVKTINELRQVDPEGVALALMGMMDSAAANTAAANHTD